MFRFSRILNLASATLNATHILYYVRRRHKDVSHTNVEDKTENNVARTILYIPLLNVSAV